MYEITVLDLAKHITFIKRYDSLYKLENFKKKCKFSKKVRITSIVKIN